MSGLQRPIPLTVDKEIKHDTYRDTVFSILCVLPHGIINKYYLLHVLLLYILYVYKMKEYEKISQASTLKTSTVYLEIHVYIHIMNTYSAAHPSSQGKIASRETYVSIFGYKDTIS